MKILKGRHAGQRGALIQFANDWVNVELPSGKSVILNPTQVEVEPAERARFAQPRLPAYSRRLYGSFFDEWLLGDDGRFTALRELPRRLPRRRFRRRPRTPNRF